MITQEQREEFLTLQTDLEKSIRSHQQYKDDRSGTIKANAEAKLREARERLHDWLRRVSQPEQPPVQES